MIIKFQLSLSRLKKQQGAALITSLVFMGILTMLGISAMRSNTMDIKIHNSMKDRVNAFQCAEAAIRQGERFIKNANSKPMDDGGVVPDKNLNQVWDEAATLKNKLVNADDSWWAAKGWADSALSDADVQVGCASSARYIVQSLAGGGSLSGCITIDCRTNAQISAYRITSRSEGVSSNAAVILQTTFVRQF